MFGRLLCNGRVCACLLGGLLAGLASSGCSKPKESPPSVTDPTPVQLVKPTPRTIVRIVGQPSFVEGFERTSIYPKVNGYIKKWNVDIGDVVKKDDVLCTLFVPELEEDWETKKATVLFDKQRVELAEKIVKVAEADVKAAAARVAEAKAILDQYHAQVQRWESEVKRLTREVKAGTVDPQVLLESENQIRSSTAAWNAAKATIQKTEAELLSKQATLAQNIVDVAVARAKVRVDDSDAKRLEAWVGYITLTAPYDGVIVARNANTGDFVMPINGDPSADRNAPHARTNNSAPIYVVERSDIVRVFVDIPDQDANYVQKGTKASVLIQAYSDQPIEGTVERTSWALNVTSRTLRAEIDLKNPGGKILPGMYAYPKVVIKRDNVLSLPNSAFTYSGENKFYWRYENGQAMRTPVRIGITDGEWTEVTNRQLAENTSGREENWAPVHPSEQVILGDLSVLTHGARVRIGDAVAQKPDQEDVKLAANRPNGDKR